MNTPEQFAFVLALAAPQEAAIRGGALGTQQVIVGCSTPPAAGSATLEYQLVGDPTWRPFVGGTAFSLITPRVLSVYGALSRIRITPAGVDGGAGLFVWVNPIGAEGFPPKAFEGYRALNVQGYTETNVKLGLQQYVQHILPTLNAGASYDLLFRVGALPALVKSREFTARGETIKIQVFRNPTWSAAGTPVTVHNFSDTNPVAAQTLVTSAPTITATGAAWGDGQRIFGASASGQRIGGQLPPGGDRILAPNTAYLVRVSNIGTGTADADYFLTWAEVLPDLPLP